MIHLVTIDYVTIAFFFALLIGVGLWYSRRQKSGGDFFAGGRRIPWWVAGAGLFMANFSAWMYTGFAGLAYNAGPYALLYLALLPIAYYLGTLLTATRWRRTRSVSQVEFTRTRFNVLTQQILAIALSLLFLLTTGNQFLGVCKLIAPSLHIEILHAIFLVGFIALIYTSTGGIWAATICDFIQFLVLMGVTVTVVVLSVAKVGGPGAFLDGLEPLKLRVQVGSARFDEFFILGMLLNFTIGTAQGGGQLFFSVRDEKAARRVGFFAGTLFLFGPILFGVVPLVAKSLWPTAASIPGPEGTPGRPDQVFLLVCNLVLPTGTMGLFLAAALSATLDNLSMTSNMISSYATRDIAPLFRKTGFTPAGELRFGRIVSFAVGLVLIGAAILSHELDKRGKSLFQQMVTYVTLFGPPISIPIVFGLRMKSFPRWGAVAAIMWGFLLGLSTNILLLWPDGPRLCLVIGTLVSICFLSVALSRWWKKHRVSYFVFGILVAALFQWLFVVVTYPLVSSAGRWLPWSAFYRSIWIAPALLGVAWIILAILFSRETEEDRKPVEEFFQLLDTPIDVEKELGTGASPTVTSETGSRG